jgi:hypothetical protein
MNTIPIPANWKSRLFTMWTGQAFSQLGSSLAGNLVVCLMLPIIDGSLFAILQSVVRPEKQGRVFSIILCVSAVSSLIGLLVACPIVDTIGLPLWFLLAGLVSACVGFSGFLFSAVMKIEQGSQGIS